MAGGSHAVGGLRAAALLVAACLTTPPAHAGKLNDADALRISQAAIGRTVAGVKLTTATGERLTFEQLRGRPVVLSLVYTSCYHVCSGLTLRLREALGVARDALGADTFTAVTVGFDTANDSPERMRVYARERGADVPGWYFASGDAAAVARLMETVGFTYVASPKGYDHVTQTTIIDAGGRVVLQVYGEDFVPPLVVEPLKKLVWGQNLDRRTLDGLLNTVKLVCTIYDPTSGRYRFDYSLIVNIVAGSLALGIALAAILAAMRNVK